MALKHSTWGSRITQAITAFLDRAAIRGPVLLGCSGGADSVALLRAWPQADSREAPQGVVAHVHHGIRGAAADADAEFVRQLAQQAGWPFALLTVQLPTRGNLEANARKARYEALGRCALEHRCEAVAVAHHAEDQLETILMALLRGSGLQGAAGMRPRRKLSPTVQLIRPLLPFRRAELLQYLSELGQLYQSDAMNQDSRYTRVAVRQQLATGWLQAFPNWPQALEHYQTDLEETEAWIRAAVEQLNQAHERPRAGSVVVVDAQLGQAPDFLRRQWLRWLWRREGWPARDFTRAHWKAASQVLQGQPVALDCPGGLHIRHRGQVVCLGPAS